MLKNKFALFLRIVVLFPLAGLLAALPSVGFDDASGVMTVDLSAVSVAIGGVIWAAVSGGTFGWSRWVKRLGGLT